MDSNPLSPGGMGLGGMDSSDSDSTASDSEDDMVLTRLVDSPKVKRKSPTKAKSPKHSGGSRKSKKKSNGDSGGGLSASTMAKLAALEEQERKAEERKVSLADQLEKEQVAAKAKKEKHKAERQAEQKLIVEQMAAPVIDLKAEKARHAAEEEAFVSPRVIEVAGPAPKSPRPKASFSLNLDNAKLGEDSDDDSSEVVHMSLSSDSSDDSSSDSSTDDSSEIDLAALAAAAGMGGDDEDLAMLAQLDQEHEDALDEIGEDEEERERLRKKREKKKAKKKAAKKAAKKLRFIGQQFANMKVDIKALVEEEKAKADVYDFEWERKEKDPNWKQGLLKASIKPQEGLDYLARMNLIEDSLEGRARWLAHYRVNILDNEAVVDWLARGPNYAMLEAVVDHENNFLGYDMEMAFRRFIWQMDNLPSDPEGLKRVFQAFGAKYRGDNPSRQKVKSAEAASFLCNAMLVLSLAFHHSQYEPDSSCQKFIKSCGGQNAGQDFDQGMLGDLYVNVVECPVDFRVTCLYPNAFKLGYVLVRSYDPGKKRDKSQWKKKWCVLNNTTFESYDGGSRGEPDLSLDLKMSEYLTGITTSKPCFGIRELGQDIVHCVVALSDWSSERWNWWCKREAHDTDTVEFTLSDAVPHGPKMLSPRGKGKGSPFGKGKKKKAPRGKKGATIDLNSSPGALTAARIDRKGERVRNFDSESDSE